MQAIRTTTLFAFALFVAFALAAPGAQAGTKYQANLAPDAPDDVPGFQANGSRIMINDKLQLKGKVKKITDGAGILETTDPADPGDDYSVEVDFSGPGSGLGGTVTVFFDVKKGNAKFAADLSNHPLFAGAVSGDAIRVDEVRVYSSDTQFGEAGFTLR